MITQLRPASERLRSSWIFGSATMATVLSMVASSCIPPMATTAARNRVEGIQSGVRRAGSATAAPASPERERIGAVIAANPT